MDHCRVTSFASSRLDYEPVHHGHSHDVARSPATTRCKSVACAPGVVHSVMYEGASPRGTRGE